MTETLTTKFNDLVERANQSTHDHYLLEITNILSMISVLSIVGKEQLNQPWRYEIQFTCDTPYLDYQQILNQEASLIFNPTPLSEIISDLANLYQPETERTLHGVITQFVQLSSSKDETRYQIVLEDRDKFDDLEDELVEFYQAIEGDF